jgi:serine/threonine protein kinase
MSPEQAKGRAADRRSDIWAFGVVVYEMLTGQRVFKGEHVSDTLASILTREPDWAALPADVRVLDGVGQPTAPHPPTPRRTLQIISTRYLAGDTTTSAGNLTPPPCAKNTVPSVVTTPFRPPF